MIHAPNSRLLTPTLVMAFTFAAAAATPVRAAPDDALVVVSVPASPRVAYALARDAAGLTVTRAAMVEAAVATKRKRSG